VQVGHAGTLDPMATGLLIVCVGQATRQVDLYQAMDKLYTGTLKLGEATASYDAETEVTQR
jgi:tRNA pseudouridine55 synthase